VVNFSRKSRIAAGKSSKGRRSTIFIDLQKAERQLELLLKRERRDG
jgi:hypothetical protein